MDNLFVNFFRQKRPKKKNERVFLNFEVEKNANDRTSMVAVGRWGTKHRLLLFFIKANKHISWINWGDKKGS